MQKKNHYGDETLSEVVLSIPERKLMFNYKEFLIQQKIWLVLIVLIILASLFSSGRFLSTSNLINVLFLAAPIGIAATGQTMVMITGGIDLSVVSTWTLAAVVGGTEAAQGVHPILALCSALLVGFICGAINGWLIAYLKVPPLIATLGMFSIAEGFARIYSGDMPVMDMPANYQVLGNGHISILPIQTIIWVVILVIFGVVLQRSIFGKSVYAIGGNTLAAKYAGLPVKTTLFVLYIFSGILAALAGTLQSAYLNIAPPNADLGTLFDIIAGSVIGGTSLFGGEGSVVKTVAGVIAIVLIENVLRIMGISPLVFQAVVGVVIVLAVFLNVSLGKGKTESKVRHKGI